MTDSRGHIPSTDKWEFDSSVTECFEDMLEKSIPQYRVMRDLCNYIVRKYRRDSTDIIDIGASRGDGVAELIKEYGAYNRWVLAEISQPMVDVLQQRFAGYIDSGRMEIWTKDIADRFPQARASVVLSALTMQFIPIERRQKVMESIYDALLPGGALVIVEKVLGANSSIDELMVERYYDFKRISYDENIIQRKKMALSGVLVPLTYRMNEDLLRDAGFNTIDCFWRWMNFCGWVAVK